jgi:hypothetical protein
MKTVILEFTLNGHKHTYYRRTDIYGKPVTTTNINSARKLKESAVPGIVKLLIKEHGKDNVKDINLISGDD